ncbi:MAG TPA: hypothetical protein VIB39_09270 [Candidatus Angelobacter sp.]
MKIQSTEKVRDLVSKYPGAAPVLAHFGIHYSQSAGQSIGEACANASIHFPDFARQIYEGNFHSGEEVTYWKKAPLGELVEHIVEHHHAFVKNESPRIEVMLQAAVRQFGTQYPEVQQILEIFRALTEDMGQHGDREEQLLFPFIRELAASANAGKTSTFAPEKVDSLIFALMQEHAAAAGLREKITELTRHYTVPRGARPEKSELYKALFDFECDLHRHLYLEDNFLYPRTLKLSYQRPHTPAS